MPGSRDGEEQTLKKHRIDHIVPGGIAEELNLKPGDWLLSINGQEVGDVFDYHYLCNEEYLTVEVERKGGEIWELEIEKEYEEDLGIGFENGLMDEYKSCCNRCIFCFIDQMPPGMRETLYFKDDDSRLSFLQGNYVTLTNMKEHDISRIIDYKLGPINISVHTTNPELRCKMLNNRFAGEALKKIDRLYEAGIPLNGQIVLCKGVNDKEELERSIRDLTRYLPVMESVSVVPEGLSRFREGLYPLEPFTKADAGQVIDAIERWQRVCYEEHGLHFVHASDEWYLLAERELPQEERYDGYLQLENGVGMLRLLEEEFSQALEEEFSQALKEGTVSIATGLLAAPSIRRLAERLTERYPGRRVTVYSIENRFFGERITVSGLLTGRDLVEQLAGKELGDRLLLPCNLLRSGEEVFLDDMTLTEMKNTLQVPIDIVESNGRHLMECMLK